MKGAEEITETGTGTGTGSGIRLGFGARTITPPSDWNKHELDSQAVLTRDSPSPTYIRDSQLSGQTAAVEMPTADHERAELPGQTVPPKNMPAELPTPVQSRRPSQ